MKLKVLRNIDNDLISSYKVKIILCVQDIHI